MDRNVRIAVFTDSDKVGFSNDKLTSISKKLNAKNIPIILADQCGLFCRIINDFGTHTVNDATGDEVLDIMIQ